MQEYKLTPRDSHKSFYGKATVRIYRDGTEVLKSYDTNVLRRDPDGTMHRLWHGWSATTGRHIAAFAGINKKEWCAMPVEHDDTLTRLIWEAAAMKA